MAIRRTFVTCGSGQLRDGRRHYWITVYPFSIQGDSDYRTYPLFPRRGGRDRKTRPEGFPTSASVREACRAAAPLGCSSRCDRPRGRTVPTVRPFPRRRVSSRPGGWHGSPRAPTRCASCVTDPSRAKAGNRLLPGSGGADRPASSPGLDRRGARRLEDRRHEVDDVAGVVPQLAAARRCRAASARSAGSRCRPRAPRSCGGGTACWPPSTSPVPGRGATPPSRAAPTDRGRRRAP